MDDLQFRGLETLEIPVKSKFLSRNVYRQNTISRDKLKFNQASSKIELNFYCPSLQRKLLSICPELRLYDMNGIFQMQGGKNRILPK
jgi:hypothetical protein